MVANPQMLSLFNQIGPWEVVIVLAVLLLLFGGPSQLETFDMKPEAPDTIRGPFQPIASRTPGLRICEHLPLTADVSDRFAVVKTLSHS